MTVLNQSFPAIHDLFTLYGEIGERVIEGLEVVGTVASMVDGKGYDVKVLPMALDGATIHLSHFFTLVTVDSAAESAQNDMAHTSLDQSRKLCLDARFHLLITVYMLANFFQVDGG